MKIIRKDEIINSITLDVKGDINDILEDAEVFRGKKMSVKSLVKALDQGHYALLNHVYVKVKMKIPYYSAMHFRTHTDLNFSIRSQRLEIDPEIYIDDMFLNSNLKLFLEHFENSFYNSVDSVNAEKTRTLSFQGQLCTVMMSGSLKDIYFMLLQRACHFADPITREIALDINNKLANIFPEFEDHFNHRCYAASKVCNFKCLRSKII
jgi:hypothetical protein